MEVAKLRSEKSAETATDLSGRRRLSISVDIVKPSNLRGNARDLNGGHSLSD
jgi:hypothetical protein